MTVFWYFGCRSLIQSALPEIFEDLASLFRNTAGRMSAFQVLSHIENAVYDSLSHRLYAFAAVQIEDRVKKLFAVWTEWSIFPTLFVLGLQAVFYFSEQEQLTLSQYIAAKTSGTIDGAQSVSADEIEALRRRAKAAGIAHTEQTSRHEIEYRLDWVERYAKHLLSAQGGGDLSAVVSGGGHTGAAGQLSYLERLNTFAEQEEEDTPPVDDIDGVPLHHKPIHTISAGGDAARATDRVELDIDGAPLEDIDGAPLEDIDGAPLEDIDGAPLEDIDGAPLEDIDGAPLEDIDGAPLEDASPTVYDDDIDGMPL